MESCNFWRLKLTKSTKFRAKKKLEKTAFFALLDPLKLISRKIWVIEKSWNLRNVPFFLLEIAFYLAIIEKVFTAEEKIIEQPKAFHGSIRRIDLPPKSLVNPNFRYGLIQLFEKLSYLTRFIVIELFFEGHVACT